MQENTELQTWSSSPGLPVSSQDESEESCLICWCMNWVTCTILGVFAQFDRYLGLFLMHISSLTCSNDPVRRLVVQLWKLPTLWVIIELQWAVTEHPSVSTWALYNLRELCQLRNSSRTAEAGCFSTHKGIWNTTSGTAQGSFSDPYEALSTFISG